MTCHTKLFPDKILVESQINVWQLLVTLLKKLNKRFKSVGWISSPPMHLNKRGRAEGLNFCFLSLVLLGPVVQKPINANPGLKVNRGFNFSCIKVFFTANVSQSLRLLKVKTERQKILTENLTEK